MHHDEDVQVYINGQLVLDLEGYTTNYESEEIPATVLRKAKNVIAVHCRQSADGQYIDVGLDAIVPAEE